MKAKFLFLGTAGLLAAGLGLWNGLAQKASVPLKPKLSISIKPADVANALRAVIASDREVCAQSGLQASVARNPSPCEFLRRSSEATASKGVEFSYVLRSLQPSDPRNTPETPLERKGLEFVAGHPDASFSSEEILGGRWYYTAVYPDVAVHQSCVDCHNRRQDAARKEYRLGDVMGGLVVRVALEL